MTLTEAEYLELERQKESAAKYLKDKKEQAVQYLRDKTNADERERIADERDKQSHEIEDRVREDRGEKKDIDGNYEPTRTKNAIEAGKKEIKTIKHALKVAAKKEVDEAKEKLKKYKDDLMQGREDRRAAQEAQRSFFYMGGNQKPSSAPRKQPSRAPAPRRAPPRASPRRNGTILSGVMGGKMVAGRGGNIGGSWHVGTRTPFKQSGSLGLGNRTSPKQNILQGELGFLNPQKRGNPTPSRRGNSPLDSELGFARPKAGSSFLDKMFAYQKKPRRRR
jgi:hypothetical protein